MMLIDRKISTLAGALLVSISLVTYYFYHSLYIYLYFTGLGVLALPSLRGMLASLAKLKINTDTLMVVASIGAILLGHLEDAVLILLVYSIAEVLEDVFIDRARGDLESFTKDMPRKVTKVENGHVREVPVDECEVGDIVVLKPGQMVPFDGVLESDGGLLDESSVTGEPFAVFKPKGSEIYSGSIVLKSPIKVKIKNKVDESLYMKIVKHVMESMKRRSGFERYVIRISNHLAKIVLGSFIIILGLGYLLGSPQIWAYRGLALLVVGCPSAFLLSTSITSYRTVSILLREGVIVKGSYNMEQLSKTKILALDKTGTVTLGKPFVSEVKTFNNLSPIDILRYAYSLEIYSSHPIAKAIIEEASKNGIEPLEVESVQEILGKGLIGYLRDGKRILVGNSDLLNQFGLKHDVGEANSKGLQVLVAYDDRVIGAIRLEDREMPGVKGLGKKLRELGVEPVLITGDKEDEAKRIAEVIGVKEYHAEMKPEDKLKLVKKYRKLGKTAMVGDGVNDAMALSKADLGIAITKPGREIVQTAAGIEIHRWDDASKLVKLIEVARRYMSLIKRLVYTAITVKAILIVMALMGYLPIWGAVLGDDGLTIALSTYAIRGSAYVSSHTPWCTSTSAPLRVHREHITGLAPFQGDPAPSQDWED